MDAGLSSDQRQAVRTEIFTNPVTQISSYDTLPLILTGAYGSDNRPGVKDNPGSTAVEAIEDVLKIRLKPDEDVYTSRRYCLKGDHLNRSDVELVATELLANDIIQQVRVYSKDDWDSDIGIGFIIPKVKLDHTPTVSYIPMSSDAALSKVSEERNLALNENDVPVIRSYFNNPDVQSQRKQVGLSEPTDVELEYISQARSDHCNHNTFRGVFTYTDFETGKTETIESCLKLILKRPLCYLRKKKTGSYRYYG